MITYVNTVLVSNLASSNVIATKSAYNAITTSDAGKFVVVTLDEKPAMITTGTGNDAVTAADAQFPVVTADTAALYETIKIGIITNKTSKQVNPSTGATVEVPVIKWSNKISADSVKSCVSADYVADTEDTAYINLRSLDSTLLTNVLSKAGKRIIVRLTFKDLPTRFRKWTESYEYITEDGDTVATIAANITNMINREWKRARVTATLGTASAGSNSGDPDTIAATQSGSESGANAIILTAMKYDDDESVDSLNWANKVRFNVNVYYTDPAADGWESTNKHFPEGVEITKVPGKTFQASAKLVRDREAQAMGYQGILNRGEGTWPIVKPAMETNLNNKYSVTTLEFERMYRTADDLQRRTKECVELYGNCTLSGSSITANGLSGIRAILDAFVRG